MLSLKVKEIAKVYHQAEGVEVVTVTASLFQDGKFIEDKNLGFPLGTSEKEIKVELGKWIKARNSDHEAAMRSLEADAQDKQLKKTEQNLKGQTFK